MRERRRRISWALREKGDAVVVESFSLGHTEEQRHVWSVCACLRGEGKPFIAKFGNQGGEMPFSVVLLRSADG